MTQEELYLRMKRSLALPPSRAGVAIKSEPALARLVGLKRPTIRKVMDRLVDEGILVRRNGSGTYVRKVAPETDIPIPEGAALFSGESLFNIFEERQQRCQPLNKDKQIRIATVIDFNAPSPSAVYKRIFDGLRARAAEIGAIVEICPLGKIRTTKDAGSRIRTALSATRCDGLIISSTDEQVLEALAKTNDRAVVYLDFANRDWNLRTDLAPMVSFDLRQAMIDALKRLYGYGHRKISIVGFANSDSPSVDQAEDEILYNHIMDRLDLSFRRTAFLGNDDVENERRLRKLLAGGTCTGIYFCDDVALMKAYPTLIRLGYAPGENLALITHSNKGIRLPSGVEWSRMEFDPLQVATLVLDAIVAGMKSALPDLISLSHKPMWIEGTSHRYSNPKTKLKIGKTGAGLLS